MADDAVERAPDATVPVGFALVKLVAHLAFNVWNTQYGYFRDELYYIACGRHPALGYVDQPPGAPLVARLSEIAFGSSVFAIRLFPALASSVIVLFAGLVARELGGRRFAQGIACLTTLLAPVYLRTGLLFETVVFDQLCWTLACFLVIRLLRTGQPRLLLAIGAVCGVGLEFKHTMIFLVMGLLVGFAATPARRHLARRETAGAVVLALALFLPNLVWQMLHGWPTLEFLRAIHEGKMTGTSWIGFVLLQVAMLHPWSGLLWAVGVAHLLFTREGAPFRAIGIAYVTILSLFAVMGSKHYYLAAFYPTLLGAGGVRLELLVTRPRLRWLETAYPALVTFLGVAVLPVSLPVLGPERLAGFLHAVFGDLPFRGDDRKLEPLPQDYADMIGWDHWVRKVSEVQAGLPADERAEAVVLTGNYGEAAAIDVIGGKMGLPPAISGHNNYWLWGPGSGSGRIVIAVGLGRRRLDTLFADVHEAGRIDDPFARREENDLPIWVCRDPIVPLADAWASLRHYN